MNENKYNHHSPINIPNMTPLNNKNNPKILNNHLAPTINKNRDNQNSSMELFGSLVGSYEVYLFIYLFIYIFIYLFIYLFIYYIPS